MNFPSANENPLMYENVKLLKNNHYYEKLESIRFFFTFKKHIYSLRRHFRSHLAIIAIIFPLLNSMIRGKKDKRKLYEE